MHNMFTFNYKRNNCISVSPEGKEAVEEVIDVGVKGTNLYMSICLQHLKMNLDHDYKHGQ